MGLQLKNKGFILIHKIIYSDSHLFKSTITVLFSIRYCCVATMLS